MNIKEFTEEIKTTYHKYFPESICHVKLSKNLYNSISITCLLSNSKEEVAGGIWENDMFSLRFYIDTEIGQFNKDITEDSETPDNLKIEFDRKSYTLKPTVKHMAYDSKKLNFRKTKGDSKKILNTLDKYFKKLYDELKADLEADKIHNNHKDLLIEKMGLKEV